VSDSPQGELPLSDVYRHRLWMDRKLAAARKVVQERTIKVVADELEQIWGGVDHPCSASTLANALSGINRNYWRSEWDSWFCAESDEFREVVAEMVGLGKTKKKPEDVLSDLKRLMLEELSSARALKLITKAETL
jgi:hypothetical protein